MILTDVICYYSLGHERGIHTVDSGCRFALADDSRRHHADRSLRRYSAPAISARSDRERTDTRDRSISTLSTAVSGVLVERR
jgi:hypothetical protein